MHFRNGESAIDGEGFFLYKGEDWSPLKELNATIDSFAKNIKVGRLKQHPQCAFPARYSFLKKKLRLKIKEIKCLELNAWKNGMDANSITLVFASSFPNNPASLFGHTFLKFNNDKNGSELLDYALNYAAATGNDGAVPFAMFGLFGFYEGHYSISPYYLKINEYSSFENRDLWEYKLTFSKSEIDMLLNHIWEIESNSFSWYYFLDENCSYQLLTLFEVLRENLDLTSGYGPYVNPVDTIKAVVNRDLVKNVRYRPSLRKRFFKHFQTLSTDEKDTFFNLVASKDQYTSNSRVLDAAILYFKHKKLKKRGKLSNKELKDFNRFLSLKTKYPASNLSRPIIPDPPENGHDSRSVSLAYKGSKFERSILFQGKLGMHNLLNNDIGYIPFSNIDGMGISLEYNKDKKLVLDYFNIISAKSLDSFSFLEKSLSFGFDVTYRKSQFTLEQNRYLGEFNGYGGLSTDYFGANTRLYILANAFFYTRDLFLGGSLIPGLLVDWGFGKSHIYAKPYYSFTKRNAFTTYHAEFSMFANRNLEFHVKIRYFDRRKSMTVFANDHLRFTLAAQYFF